MLLPFSFSVVERPPVWEGVVRSVYCACLSRSLVKFCVCPSFPFGNEGGMRDVIVLIPDHYLSVYFAINIKNCNIADADLGKRVGKKSLRN